LGSVLLQRRRLLGSVLDGWVVRLLFLQPNGCILSVDCADLLSLKILYSLLKLLGVFFVGLAVLSWQWEFVSAFGAFCHVALY